MGKRVTIYDVAEVSGVSPATVSRAISGNPLVKEKLRNKVLKAARNVGYSTNRSAKRAIQRADTLQPQLDIIWFGMQRTNDGTIPEPEIGPNAWGMQLLHGIQSEAIRLSNAKVTLRPCHQSILDSQILDTFNQRDGLIVMGAVDKHIGCIDQLETLNIPMVLAGRQIAGKDLNYVISEDIPACQKLVDYLYDLGFRRFGCLGGPKGVKHFEDRLVLTRGYLASKGLQILPKDCLFFNDFLVDEVLPVMDQWISENDLPEVLICVSGYPVVCIQRAMASHGLVCPDDLSLVCFDNSEFLSFCHPKPTRMATFPEEIGRRAYRRILEMIQDDREKPLPETILIPTKFIEGESVRAPR